MINDISSIMRIAGVENDGLNPEFYQSGASGACYSQLTPDVDLEIDTTGKTKSRSNFSPAEDLVLISAWLNISLDPIRSTNQKAEQYWKRIGKYYNEHVQGRYQLRTDKSLQGRWGKIQQGVNKFCGIHSAIEANRKSGATDLDLIEEAKLAYRSCEKTDFQYEHCWNKLRYQCKWIDLGTQGPVKEKVVSSDTVNLDGEENVAADFVDLVRPPGKRKSMALGDSDDEQGEENEKEKEKEYEKGKGKAKKKRKPDDTSQFDVAFSNYVKEKLKDDGVKMAMAKEHMELEKMKINIEMMKVEAEKERQKTKREKDDQALMMMNVSTLDTEMQRNYFAKLQADAYSRIMSN